MNEAYDGASNVVKSYPCETIGIGNTVMTAFRTYIDKMAVCTTSNSTFLSTRTTSILETFSLFNKLGVSPSYLVYQYGKALPDVSTGYRNLVRNLSHAIGSLVRAVNDGITLVENANIQTLTQFGNRFIERKFKRCERIDFEEVVKSVRFLTNTVALIAETALHDCGCVTYANEAYEAISILIFILDVYLMGVQGSNVNIATELLNESKTISPFLDSCFKAIDPLLSGIAKALDAINTNDLAKSVRNLVKDFVAVVYSFNDALDEIIGPCGGVDISVAQIKRSLLRSQGN